MCIRDRIYTPSGSVLTSEFVALQICRFSKVIYWTLFSCTNALNQPLIVIQMCIRDRHYIILIVTAIQTCHLLSVNQNYGIITQILYNQFLFACLVYGLSLIHISPFVQVGTYPTRNFATLGPL